MRSCAADRRRGRGHDMYCDGSHKGNVEFTRIHSTVSTRILKNVCIVDCVFYVKFREIKRENILIQKSKYGEVPGTPLQYYHT